MGDHESYLGRKFITTFLNNPIEKNMGLLVSYCRSNKLIDDDILLLANGLADSGQKIKLNIEDNLSICDIPSTGGPASLSTLLCPLFLVDLNKTVLKLGVSGRPAGGIDVLAQIKGYNITPDIDQINSWIKSNKYVHFLANKNFTPLDALLFKFRKENGGVAIYDLVIASLLSKKIAVGLNLVGLDIRVSNFGNFGNTWEEAKENAILSNKVANLAGIKSKCYLVNGNLAQQPYIGRGESILALKRAFDDNNDAFLQNHVINCFKMASLLSESKKDVFSLNSIRDIFFNNVHIQGGTKDYFEEKALNVELEQKYFIEASENGFIEINLQIIRDIIVKIQKEFSGEFPDPCGLVLKVKPNDYVEKGCLLCSFRCVSQYVEEFRNSLRRAFTFSIQKNVSIKFEEII